MVCTVVQWVYADFVSCAMCVYGVSRLSYALVVSMVCVGLSCKVCVSLVGADLEFCSACVSDMCRLIAWQCVHLLCVKSYIYAVGVSIFFV